MKTLNIVMIVKNEEASIGRCLEQVKDLADKLIVADTGSTDKTKEIALFYGAELFDFTWIQDFSAARNFALDQSDADWNLILDADEYLIEGCRNDIERFMENQEQLGAIQIHNSYLDGNGISVGVNYTTRLLPKGVRFTGKIHEQANSSLPRVPLPLVFDHDGYLLTNKEGRNLPILLKELSANPNDPYFLYQTAAAYRSSNHFQEALPYFERFYFLVPDHANYRPRGVIAYIYNLIELKLFEQCLELVRCETLKLKNHADFHFACGIFYMKLVLSNTSRFISYMPMIEQSYLQCLKIGEVPENGGILGTGSFKAAYNLGLWYEMTKSTALAKKYYRMAAESGHEASANRLRQLK